MLCPKCGNILDESETSCKNCGAKVKSSSLGKKSTEEAPKVEAVKQEVVEQPQPVEQPVETYYSNDMYEENYQYDMSQDEYDSLRQNINYAKRSNNSILIIVIVLICIVTVFIGFLVVKQLRGDGIRAQKDTTTSSGKSIEPTTTEKGEETVVDLNGYYFTVPSNYKTEVSNGMAISRDYDNKVQLVFNVMPDLSYEEVVLQSKDYEDYLNQLGFAVDSYGQVKYSNRQWLIYNGVLNERDSMYAITALGSNASFQVTIYNFGTKTNNAIYAELGKIVASAGADIKKEEPKEVNPGNQSGSGSGTSNPGGSGDSVIA